MLSLAAPFPPLADLVAKIRREETYHLLHLDAWMRRLAAGGPDARERLANALDRLWPDSLSVFAPLDGEAELLNAGVLSASMAELASQQWDRLRTTVRSLGLDVPADVPSATGGRDREGVSPGFAWLWGEFTSVYRSDPGATW